MYANAICEPAYALQHLTCPLCLDFPACRTSDIFLSACSCVGSMYSNESTNDRCMVGRDPTCGLKGSVHSMKSLLPLKLASPTLQTESWPRSPSEHRSTFGKRISLASDGERYPIKTNNHLGLRLSQLLPRTHRDVPIYNERGSPLPGQPYYPDDDIYFHHSPQSQGGESRVHQGRDQYHDSVNQADHHHVNQQNSLDGNDNDLTRLPYTSPEPRCSRLSFQCSGEKMFVDEGAWLGSPLPSSPPRVNTRQLSVVDDAPLAPDVDSWLEETMRNANQVYEDEVACAIPLSPSRAHVVDVKRNTLVNLAVPPRSSSLLRPLLSGPKPFEQRLSWASSEDSSLDTPIGEWEFDTNKSQGLSYREPQWIFPSRPRDLAVASPPASPAVVGASHIDSYTAVGLNVEHQASRWSHDTTIPETDPNTLILSDLEVLISGFPSSMPLPDSECITTIRLTLTRLRSQPLPPTKCTSPPLSPTSIPEPHAQVDRITNTNKSIENFSRPRRVPRLTPSKSAPSIFSSTWTNSPTLIPSTITTPATLPTPDLRALHRIFPNSTEFTRLALYAHLLAHIFLSTFPGPTPPPMSHRRRRDTPHWTSPALPNRDAAVPASSPDYVNDAAFQIRVQLVKTKLRKCIFRLMNNMDDSTGVDMLAARRSEVETASGNVMLRAVEEVVRAEEVRCFGMF